MLSYATRAKNVINKVLKQFSHFYTIYMYSIMCGTYFVQLHQRQLHMPTTNPNNCTIENGYQTFHTTHAKSVIDKILKQFSHFLHHIYVFHYVWNIFVQLHQRQLCMPTTNPNNCTIENGYQTFHTTRAKNVIDKILKQFSHFLHHIYVFHYVWNIFVQLHQRQLCMPTTNPNNCTIENGNQTFHTTRAKSVIDKILKQFSHFLHHIYVFHYVWNIFVQLHQRQLCMPTTNPNNYTIENGNQTFHTQDFFTFQ
jgi:hypothetical protein